MERCIYCKKVIQGAEKIVYNGLNESFCSLHCFLKHLEKEKERNEYNFLYKTICRIFHLNQVTPKLFAEIKRLKENEHLTYKQISAILHYMYDIKELTIYSPTLYYVTQYIEDSKNYYNTIKLRELQAKKSIEENSKLPTRIIKPNYNYKNKRNNGLKINPDNIL